MAVVNFAPEQERPPLDYALEIVAQQCAERGKAIRFRVQPDLYSYEQQTYVAWTGLTWIVEIADVEEGRRMREGLQWLFRLFGTDEAGQVKVLATLQALAEQPERV